MTVNFTPCTIVLSPGTYDVSCLGETKRVDVKSGMTSEVHFGKPLVSMERNNFGVIAVAAAALGLLVLASLAARGGVDETSRE